MSETKFYEGQPEGLRFDKLETLADGSVKVTKFIILPDGRMINYTPFYEGQP